MKIVIHGGMHKTGTTSFQQLMFSNRDELIDAGVFYPEVGMGQHGSMLNVRGHTWSADACQREVESALAAGSDILLLSAELVSVLSLDQITRIVECFEGHEVTYLLCFRHWSEYLPSRWSQYCRRRDSQTFESYLCGIETSAHIDLRYDRVLDIAAASGCVEIVAVSYDNAVDTEGDVLPILMRAAGIDETLAATFLAKATHLNERSPWQQTEIMRCFNGIIADKNGLAQDELFRSIGNSRQCDRFFDTISHFENINSSDASDLFALVEIASESRPFRGTDASQFVMRRLESDYGHLFINRIDGRIFSPAKESLITACNLHWREIYAAGADTFDSALAGMGLI